MVLVCAVAVAACGALAAGGSGVAGRWLMSPTDVGLLVAALIALIGAGAGWLRADTAAKEAAANRDKIADLGTTTAVHAEKINGLLAPRVQEIMAPVVAAAIAEAHRAALTEIAAHVATRTDSGRSTDTHPPDVAP